MALAIDIDTRNPSNKMLCQLQPKKTKVMLCYSFTYVYNSKIRFIHCTYFANKTERFSFKSGCVVWVTDVEMRRQLKPKKTNYKVRLGCRLCSKKDILPAVCVVQVAKGLKGDWFIVFC